MCIQFITQLLSGVGIKRPADEQFHDYLQRLANIIIPNSSCARNSLDNKWKRMPGCCWTASAAHDDIVS
jgi:hypothetical protein